MSGTIASWLLDTALYTGLLIMLVLVIRRLVANHFGAGIAYALWTLPMVRFIMPPLVLPASMAPDVGSTYFDIAALAASGASPPLLLRVSESSAFAATAPVAPGAGLWLSVLLVTIWLSGAALFLVSRRRSYRAMRRDLLAGAHPVGEAGQVRLVESPAVVSPVAFGVRDKVVALPFGFMALADREARDMAIAHELAHHRGHDLLANIAAQPLLALHWFNPLAWIGWRAMRRDQEAACDARVMAGRSRSERAVYGAVIASFATGDPRFAPLACPVRGEKSIIHRLRSLMMREVGAARRRTGLAVLGLAALGLPLTASISYAAPASPEVRAEPGYLSRQQIRNERIGYRREHEMAQVERHHARIEREHFRRERAFERVERGHARRERLIERSMEAREGAANAVDEAMQEADAARAEALAAIAEARADGLRYSRVASGDVSLVTTRIECGGGKSVIERTLADGRHSIIVCQDAIAAQALVGLEQARASISGQPGLSSLQREQLLQQLDSQAETLVSRRVTMSLRFYVPSAVAHPA